MQDYRKFLEKITEILEKGSLSSRDIKEELKNNLKFTIEKTINKLNLVSREEFEVQKKIINKLENEISKLKKKKKK
ncbi:MAG: hypothetical protein CBC24_05665 [Candidatus Pelagibacter sp. TMED64]|nr:hypothetical protein [Candidatus Pelagibacter sp.]OUU65367.1 MAG: hypothetical protein CBC24_05665 [Candidatus Pelagibacter sp. TMED64]|tara:strand:+ start:7084 stop:7311 length:228 start_codon:yes stop_codon:yes gene_type:complete